MKSALKGMTPSEQTSIRAFAGGSVCLREAAIAIHRKYIPLLGVRGTPEQDFMAEVDNPCPDLVLRAHYREVLTKSGVETGSTVLKARASPYSYVIWVTGLLFGVAHYPGLSSWQLLFIYLGVAFAGVVWLWGHRITVMSGVLEYRDGLFRIRSCTLDDVLSCENVRVTQKFLQHITAPRMRITLRENLPISINPKPFKSGDLSQLYQMLNSSLESRGRSLLSKSTVGDPNPVKKLDHTNQACE